MLSVAYTPFNDYAKIFFKTTFGIFQIALREVSPNALSYYAHI